MEQAALSATEITEDKVNEFVTDPKEDSKVEELSDYSKGSSYNWEKIVRNVVETPPSKIISKDTFQLRRGSIQEPKVNGKHNKHMQHVSLKATGEVLFQGNGVGEMILANIPTYKEVLPSLDHWQAGKVASWHNLEGHSIQWFCVVCIDRTGESCLFFSISILWLSFFEIQNVKGIFVSVDITKNVAVVVNLGFGLCLQR